MVGGEKLGISHVSDTVFAGSQQFVDVYVTDKHGSITNISSQFELTLLYDDGGTINPDSHPINIQHECRNSIQTSNKRIEYDMIEEAIHHDNKQYKFKLSLPEFPDIEPVYSNPFSVVKYRLVLNNTISGEWFKDEGGKQNQIALHIALVNSEGMLVDYEQRQHRPVSIRLTLLYDDRSPIMLSNKNDNIFRIVKDQSPIIDDNGCCQLNVRIESVSKNHNNKSFIIHIQPNLNEYPQNFDIGDFYTSPIKVKSKRGSKKRSRNDDESSLNSMMESLKRSDTVPIGISFDAAMKSLLEYCTNCNKLLSSLSFQLIGYEKMNNHMLEIHRCPCCWAYKDNRDSLSEETHAPDCKLKSLLSSWEDVMKSFQVLSCYSRSDIPQPPIPTGGYASQLQRFPSLSLMQTYPQPFPMGSPLTNVPLQSVVSGGNIVDRIDAVIIGRCFIENNQYPVMSSLNRIIGSMVLIPDSSGYSISFMPVSEEEVNRFNMILSQNPGSLRQIEKKGTDEEFHKAILDALDELFRQQSCVYSNNSIILFLNHLMIEK